MSVSFGMRKYDLLKNDLQDAMNGIQKHVENKQVIASESYRVSKVARDAPVIIEDIDKQFAAVTRLTRTDIKFLFIATGLQCLRQYIFSSDAFRPSSKEGDKLVKKVVPKKWEDILLASVPYDAIARTSDCTEIPGLGGRNHRQMTLGHDSIFGWVFGPANIITDALTKSDFITTYSVADMKISGLYKYGTMGMFSDCFEAVKSNEYLLPVAVVRQAIHFSSDYFTKQGLPIPAVGSLNKDFSQMLVKKFNIDMYSVTRSAALAAIINTIIMYVHTLFYNNETDQSPELYEVRTRKILSYSNVIASASNVIYVAVSAYFGNEKAVKNLDIGGLLVTLHRLISDYKFIAQVKEEFLAKQFYDVVMGTEYNFLKETI
jgi:hypothetical protein